MRFILGFSRDRLRTYVYANTPLRRAKMNEFGHNLGGKRWRKNFVADSNEMRKIFVLFCEDIGKICLAVNIFDSD